MRTYRKQLRVWLCHIFSGGDMLSSDSLTCFPDVGVASCLYFQRGGGSLVGQALRMTVFSVISFCQSGGCGGSGMGQAPRLALRRSCCLTSLVCSWFFPLSFRQLHGHSDWSSLLFFGRCPISVVHSDCIVRGVLSLCGCRCFSSSIFSEHFHSCSILRPTHQ